MGINAVIEVGIASVNQKKTIVNVIPNTTLELYSRVLFKLKIYGDKPKSIPNTKNLIFIFITINL